MKKILSFEMGAVVFAVVAALLLAFSAIPAVRKADANQSTFATMATLGANSATTTVTYITPGAATSTLQVSNGDGSTALETAIVNFQVISSSTPPQLKIRPEVSSDGIEWYPISTPTSTTGTTSPLMAYSEYLWSGQATSTGAVTTVGSEVASSTAGTPLNLVGTRYTGSLNLTNPEPFIRVVFYVPPGSPNIALWASIIAKREQLAR